MEQGPSTWILLLSATVMSQVRTVDAFLDKDECGLFEPEDQQLARIQVDDRIVNGYKVRYTLYTVPYVDSSLRTTHNVQITNMKIYFCWTFP